MHFSVAFGPSGDILASGRKQSIVGSGSLIVLWNIMSGQVIRKVQVLTDKVTSVAFSPSGEFLASGMREYKFRLLL